MEDALERRAARLKSECGCKAGAIALLLSVAAYSLFAMRADSVSRGIREHFVIGTCVAVAAATIGKILGMLWAHHQYRELMRAQGLR